jgi:hypothetical protein
MLPTQVLAFRRGRWLAAVDLDDSYRPTAEPTLFGKPELPGNLSALEDPRLFIHRDELYLLAFGLNNTGRWHGLQWLARLERLPAAETSETGAAAGSAAPAGFRLVQPRPVFVPEDVPAQLILPPYMDIRNPQSTQKNWVPFSYDDSICFFYSVNPPIVLRVLADPADADMEDGIRTELVSGGNTTVRWLYEIMRGGTPAVYDADIGGYITFFHSHLRYELHELSNGSETLTVCPRICDMKSELLYYMGACVFAAQPPFSIQLVSAKPIVGPDFYKEYIINNRHSNRMSTVYPAGLMAQPDAFLVSYGVNDRSMRVARLDRRQLLQTLQPPLPAGWKGPPC